MNIKDIEKEFDREFLPLASKTETHCVWHAHRKLSDFIRQSIAATLKACEPSMKKHEMEESEDMGDKILFYNAAIADYQKKCDEFLKT